MSLQQHTWIFVCCLLGFAGLAVAMERAQEDVLGRRLGIRLARLSRLAGWAWLGLALLWLVAWQGWGLGLVAYSGHTSLAAGVVFCGLIVLSRRRSRRSGTRGKTHDVRH